ncbi:MAG: twitch domain-containing radical SAM protein [Bacteroidetes bacterium]|nr:twitch domain-containing radical SAM protein [Bacteroidota bacterium]
MKLISNIVSRFKPKQDVFCIMPWVHFHVTQYGTVTPCCQAPWQQEHSFGNINESSIEEIWTNEKINLFRQNLKTGKGDKRCEQCYLKEKQGYTSLRQVANKKYSHFNNIIDKPDSMPVYFDIRFSNTCNLKCRICGPWSSSSWHSDALKLGIIDENAKPLTYAFKNTNAFFEELFPLLNTAEEFYFAGGEPLVMQEHYDILEELIKQGRTNIQLTYNTNFSSFRYKNYHIFELWKQFKNINISASLDASGLRGELLRKNIDWETVIENRKLLKKELPHIEFTVSATLNAYNLMHLPDFHKEWVNLKLINVEDFIPTLLMNPKELNISNLPINYKQKAISAYLPHIDWIKSTTSVNKEKRHYMLNQFNNIITVLTKNKGEERAEDFIKHINNLDEIRNEKTLNIFSELKELFK